MFIYSGEAFMVEVLVLLFFAVKVVSSLLRPAE